ncbi:MAG: OmpA family protein [Duncaniella sp.]|nr:OmpA family protein [Duncaniella sp.]
MKKMLLAAACVGCMMSANAQDVIKRPTIADNWSVGLDAGLTTPLKGHSFFGNMRGNFGLHVEKQISPLFGLGAEAAWGVNTSTVNGGLRSKTAFDNSYVGGYGTLNLTNAFLGFSCEPRQFTVDLVGGIGWLHFYRPGANDTNDLGAKVGLNFNYAVAENVSISLKPSVLWNVSGGPAKNNLNIHRANFNLMVGFNYNFGPGFECVTCPDNSAEIAELNDRVNALRADIDGRDAAIAAANAQNAELAAALAACQAKPAEVVKETNNTLNSVRYVFFKIGSSVITADQQPNVEMIAAYLKNHPKAKVEIRGYASPDGSVEVNERLAAARAESVKNSLIKRYKISADRISAKGEGIGHMFSEESWNRVSICTLED